MLNPGLKLRGGSDPGGRRGRARAATTAALLLLTALCGGCSISLSDMPLVGSSDKKDADPFPAVNDVPTARREDSAMAPAERNKLQNELIAARDGQNAVAAAASAAATPAPAAK